MPSTTKPSLLAVALPIPGDPYDRLMGVLISLDGRRCATNTVQSVQSGKLLLLDPLARPHFKALGFDLGEEPVRWVDDHVRDPEYLEALRLFRGLHAAQQASELKRIAEAGAAPRN